ncbi:hypothetical protein SCP_0704150 [Sparassis crispa]|uniref:Uncharacterized protein n=1 Tax=Sparassis crispa TaxID=139825 RepID=A0A401GST4_9APHY|nr:hypothetical protein SCP_0704150 [Sparassis crispa]GBE85229.1 hypothetical protein SCP_0704150 [Sparassis crispa]
MSTLHAPFLPFQVLTIEQATNRVQCLVDTFNTYKDCLPYCSLPAREHLQWNTAFETLLHHVGVIETSLIKLCILYPDEVVRTSIAIVICTHQQQELILASCGKCEAGYILTFSTIRYMTRYLDALGMQLYTTIRWIKSEEGKYHWGMVNEAIANMHNTFSRFSLSTIACAIGSQVYLSCFREASGRQTRTGPPTPLTEVLRKFELPCCLRIDPCHAVDLWAFPDLSPLLRNFTPLNVSHLHPGGHSESECRQANEAQRSSSLSCRRISIALSNRRLYVSRIPSYRPRRSRARCMPCNLVSSRSDVSLTLNLHKKRCRSKGPASAASVGLFEGDVPRSPVYKKRALEVMEEVTWVLKEDFPSPLGGDTLTPDSATALLLPRRRDSVDSEVTLVDNSNEDFKEDIKDDSMEGIEWDISENIKDQSHRATSPEPPSSRASSVTGCSEAGSSDDSTLVGPEEQPILIPSRDDAPKSSWLTMLWEMLLRR